jgi:hypothetical protein
VQDKRRRDAALDEAVRRRHNTVRATHSGECVREQVEVALLALGAFVDDLEDVVSSIISGYTFNRITPTIALMVAPLGPTTSIQAPHSAALSHTAPEYAVP